MQTLHAQLVALFLQIWSSMSGGRTPGDAKLLARAAADAIVAEADRAPALSSHAEDAAAMAVFAKRESDVRLRPGHWRDPRTGLAVDPIAQGPWQTHRLPEGASPGEFARDWLRQLHDGARSCPVSPLAPLSGSCRGLARRIADGRRGEARRLLRDALAKLSAGPEVVPDLPEDREVGLVPQVGAGPEHGVEEPSARDVALPGDSLQRE